MNVREQQHDRLRFEVLGPLTAWRGTHEVDLGPPQQRAVLAALLTAEGDRLALKDLIDAVWGPNPPGSATGSVHAYVHRLRRRLESSVIVSVDDGYRIDLERCSLDLAEFRSRVDDAVRAHRAGDSRRAADTLRAALGLWQGPPLVNVRGAHAETWRAHLTRLRTSALERCIGAELELGAGAEVVTELSVLVDDNPLDERFREMHMLALYRSGQQAAALDVYRTTRHLLAGELGVDPGPGLQDMYHRILRSDRALLRPEPPRSRTESAAAPPDPAHVPPAQLPADLPVFVGRDEHLAHMGTPDRLRSGISVITGTAGVGKTALAIHWAHRHADRFPDGQLFLNLRGFDPSGAPITPRYALRTFLESFGLSPQSLPQDLDALSARFRTLLDGRRVLILLDNARDSQQIRPLLPGHPGCHLIVTSRNRLAGLVAAEGADHVHLKVLDVQEAREFLSRRIGEGRVRAESSAADTIIGLCARLPLALSIVGTRAAIQPSFPLNALAAELDHSDGDDRLDVLSETDPDDVTDVRAAFSWSYHALTPPAARLFRLLALHPGPDITVPAAASLAGLTSPQLRRAMAELTRTHLVQEHVPGRFEMHDLLRAYAAELVGSTETGQERTEAQHRAFAHYLYTAHPAGTLYSPHRHTMELPEPVDGLCPETVGDIDAAAAWFIAEQAVLIAAVERCAALRQDDLAWRLAWAISHFLDRRGLWHELRATHVAALGAAQRLGDPAAEAYVRWGLARAATDLGDVGEARAHMERATALFASTGDATAQAESHRQLSWVAERQGDLEAALDHARRSLVLHRAKGDQARLPAALNAVGWYSTLLGRHADALDHCQEALALLAGRNQPYYEADTWDSIGCAQHHLGRLQEAVTSYRNALSLYQRLGVLYSEADTRVRLGDTWLCMGHRRPARAEWERALEVLESLHHADAASVRAKLAALREA
ncbi:BTAD domain-containing putative transcriptional regulator [Streptomyces antibioticus]|uniref:AfsR/SARP family transcriptional regulator n=1 Tax=Streptomyces antibioticus TaxID=1890 RepID=UPI0036FCCD37